MKRTGMVTTLLVLAACASPTILVINNTSEDAGSVPAPVGDASPEAASAIVEAGPPDASADASPESGVGDAGGPDGLYVAICVTVLAAGDPAQALRFRTTVAGGTVKMDPLVGWNVADKVSVIPSTVDTIAPGSPLSASWVQNGDTFVIDNKNKTQTLSAEANSISGREADLQDLRFEGHALAPGGAARFCSKLGGVLTKPYTLTFIPTQNTCLFIPTTHGATLPSIPAASFTCP